MRDSNALPFQVENSTPFTSEMVNVFAWIRSTILISFNFNLLVAWFCCQKFRIWFCIHDWKSSRIVNSTWSVQTSDMEIVDCFIIHSALSIEILHHLTVQNSTFANFIGRNPIVSIRNRSSLTIENTIFENIKLDHHLISIINPNINVPAIFRNLCVFIQCLGA